jgi:hypothetical protein
MPRSTRASITFSPSRALGRTTAGRRGARWRRPRTSAFTRSSRITELGELRFARAPSKSASLRHIVPRRRVSLRSAGFERPTRPFRAHEAARHADLLRADRANWPLPLAVRLARRTPRLAGDVRHINEASLVDAVIAAAVRAGPCDRRRGERALGLRAVDRRALVLTRDDALRSGTFPGHRQRDARVRHLGGTSR